MTVFSKSLALLCALQLTTVTSAFAAGEVSETGTAGMSFLKIAPSARIAAMGGISSARYSGASSTWANPALIAGENTRSVEFTHSEWIEGIKQEFASFTTRTSLGCFGLGVQVFDSDDIELRGNAPSSEPLGSYSIKNAAFSLTYARTFAGSISAGVTARKLFEKVSMETADGYSFDAGVKVNVPGVEGLRLAAVTRNFGRMDKLKNDRTKLPSDVVIGAAYKVTSAPGIGKDIILLGDYVIPKYGDSGLRIGAEIVPLERFYARVGYRTDSDIEDVSFGVGIIYQMFTFDAAYTPMKEGFDDVMRFSVGLTGF